MLDGLETTIKRRFQWKLFKHPELEHHYYIIKIGNKKISLSRKYPDPRWWAMCEELDTAYNLPIRANEDIYEFIDSVEVMILCKRF